MSRLPLSFHSSQRGSVQRTAPSSVELVRPAYPGALWLPPDGTWAVLSTSLARPRPCRIMRSGQGVALVGRRIVEARGRRGAARRADACPRALRHRVTPALDAEPDLQTVFAPRSSPGLPPRVSYHRRLDGGAPRLSCRAVAMSSSRPARRAVALSCRRRSPRAVRVCACARVHARVCVASGRWVGIGVGVWGTRACVRCCHAVVEARVPCRCRAAIAVRACMCACV